MRELFTWEQAQSLIGTAVEVADLDFKEAVPNLSDIEAAKDIAALANTLGGHIVIGATTTEGRTRCNGLRGVELPAATLAQQRYESGAQRIRPAVQISTRQIRVPDADRALVVVQVNAAHMAPVGLQLQPAPDHQLVEKGWVFPYRVGSQTNFFSPDQFSAFNDMPSRRAAALLSSIPPADRESVTLRGDKAVGGYRNSLREEPGPHWSLAAKLEQIDLLRNVAVFRAGLSVGDAFQPLHVPLDWVATVWRNDHQGKWIIVTECGFARTSDQWVPSRD